MGGLTVPVMTSRVAFSRTTRPKRITTIPPDDADAVADATRVIRVDVCHHHCSRVIDPIDGDKIFIFVFTPIRTDFLSRRSRVSDIRLSEGGVFADSRFSRKSHRDRRTRTLDVSLQ